MEPLTEKILTTSRGLIYRYYASDDEPSGEPAILLLHGFPETAHLWQPLLPALTSLPGKLLIPDLLGFGGTSKPTDPALYAYDLMVQDLVDICDAEGVEKVVSLGHDHGSGLAARFYNHAPHRTAGLVLLNVPYQVPERDNGFDLEAVNAAATKVFGYPALAYWHFWSAPDAAPILEHNLDRLYDCAHARTWDLKKSLYCVDGAMRQYVTDLSIPRIAIKSYASKPEIKDRWLAQFRAGGLKGPLCWYTSRVHNIQHSSDKKIASANVVVNVPTLFIGCNKDVVCRVETVKRPIDLGLLPHLTVETMQGIAHWPMYERPEETADIIVRFLRANYLC
jgi:pimeloyl-ACP methyl ester carboxylesterase